MLSTLNYITKFCNLLTYTMIMNNTYKVGANFPKFHIHNSSGQLLAKSPSKIYWESLKFYNTLAVSVF